LEGWKGWKTKKQINSKKIFGFIKNILQNQIKMAGTLPSGPTYNLIHFFIGTHKTGVFQVFQIII
jgi:hypothetical protein